MYDARRITPRILVTTDFSADSQRAFYHGLAFAVAHQARLTLLHTGPESRDAVPWDQFPGIRETLAQWGLIEAGAPRTAVAETLHVEVAKKAMRDVSPRLGITDHLRKYPTDLLVMASEGRTGLAGLLNPSVGDHVGHLTRSHTLLLPKSDPGFVDPQTGELGLRPVLCALDPSDDQGPALSYLSEWLPIFAGHREVEVILLESADFKPAPLLPQQPGIRWYFEPREDETLSSILDAAHKFDAGMLVVFHHGRLGLLERMHGSRTDQLLRNPGLPILAVPAPRPDDIENE